MAWIEVHQNLPAHRKIKRMKRLLKIKEPQAVGHMVMLWLWAIDNAPEGRLDNIDPEDLAEAAGWPGNAEQFLSALCNAGFVDEGDCLLIHDWQEYGGKLQAQRQDRAEQNRERQKRHRDKKKKQPGNVTETQDNGVTVTDRNADVTRYGNVTETQDNGVTVTDRNADVTRYGNVTETQDNATTLHYTTLHYIPPPDGGGKKGVTRNAPPPPPRSRAVDVFMKKITPTPSSASMYELLHFEGELGTDVCLRAIDEALDNNARSWQYVKAILRAKQEQGVRSLADWDRLEAQRMDAKARRTAQQMQAEEAPPVDVGDLDWLLSQKREEDGNDHQVQGPEGQGGDGCNPGEKRVYRADRQGEAVPGR